MNYRGNFNEKDLRDYILKKFIQYPTLSFDSVGRITGVRFEKFSLDKELFDNLDLVVDKWDRSSEDDFSRVSDNDIADVILHSPGNLVSELIFWQYLPLPKTVILTPNDVALILDSYFNAMEDYSYEKLSYYTLKWTDNINACLKIYEPIPKDGEDYRLRIMNLVRSLIHLGHKKSYYESRYNLIDGVHYYGEDDEWRVYDEITNEYWWIDRFNINVNAFSYAALEFRNEIWTEKHSTLEL